MLVNHLITDQREEWNTFVAKEQSFSLLQSWEWGEFKEKMGWRVYRIAVKKQGNIFACAQLLIKSLPGEFASIAYIPRGPLCNWSDRETTSCLLTEIHRIARQQKVIFLKIEPPILYTEVNHHELQQYYFRMSSIPNLPRNTLLLNIDQDQEIILSQMRQKARKYIRQTEREGITVSIGNRNDLPAYIDIMQMTCRRERFPARNRRYYELEWETLVSNDQCVLLLAWSNDKLLAVRTVYHFGLHAAEFHAGSVDNLTNLHPNYLLVWEAIKWAKSKGCKTYDLWGIPDEIRGTVEPDQQERTDGMWGVYRFKSGFSKNIVSYIGAYDYVYSPFLYAIVSNSFMNRIIFEKISIWLESLKKIS